MNNYTNNTLVPGEKIICSAHYHWFYWAKRIALYAVLIGGGVLVDTLAALPFVITAVAALLSLFLFVCALIVYTNDEMVITNHRVILKTGIFSRDVFEMQIQKVETVLVDQSIPGRIFNYGTIACRGTGGTISKQIEIEAPLDFRAAFQTAVKEANQPTYTSAAQSAATVSAALDNDKLDEIIRLLTEINQKLSR